MSHDHEYGPAALPGPDTTTATGIRFMFRTLDASRHIYQVRVSTRPHVPIGQVQRFGSLRSCRYWAGTVTGTGERTRSRDTRAQAAADVLTAWQQAGGAEADRIIRNVKLFAGPDYLLGEGT